MEFRNYEKFPNSHWRNRVLQLALAGCLIYKFTRFKIKNFKTFDALIPRKHEKGIKGMRDPDWKFKERSHVDLVTLIIFDYKHKNPWKKFEVWRQKIIFLCEFSSSGMNNVLLISLGARVTEKSPEKNDQSKIENLSTEKKPKNLNFVPTKHRISTQRNGKSQKRNPRISIPLPTKHQIPLSIESRKIPKSQLEGIGNPEKRNPRILVPLPTRR